MKTNGESKFSYLLIGLGLTAIGGLIAALLARKETRDRIRASAERLIEKGKEHINYCCGPADDASKAHEHEQKEEGRETLGA